MMNRGALAGGAFDRLGFLVADGGVPEGLRRGTRVISYVHDMGDWEPQQTMTVQGRLGERQLYLWTIASPQGK